MSSDIMQESFTRFLEHYGSDVQNVSLLFTIARNAVWDNSRKKEHNKNPENDMEDGSSNPAKKIAPWTWLVTIPAGSEFTYFYIADGAVYLPPCCFTEKDDFGSENCLFIPDM